MTFFSQLLEVVVSVLTWSRVESISTPSPLTLADAPVKAPESQRSQYDEDFTRMPVSYYQEDPNPRWTLSRKRKQSDSSDANPAKRYKASSVTDERTVDRPGYASKTHVEDSYNDPYSFEHQLLSQKSPSQLFQHRRRYIDHRGSLTKTGTRSDMPTQPDNAGPLSDDEDVEDCASQNESNHDVMCSPISRDSGLDNEQSEQDLDLGDDSDNHGDDDADMSSKVEYAFSPVSSHTSPGTVLRIERSVTDSSEHAQYRPNPHRTVTLVTQEPLLANAQTVQLRLAGWNDEHISLLTRLQTRDKGAIMPFDWKFGMPYMPAGLFARPDAGDAVFLASHLSSTASGEIGFTRLLDIGSQMRCSASNPQNIPGRHLEMPLKSYLKWAMKDVGLDVETTRPMLEISIAHQDVAPDVLTRTATRRLKRLYSKTHPLVTSTSSGHAVQIPPLYGVLCSHLLVALVALRSPSSPEVQPIAYFDFSDKDLDVWNALALAIIACHVRNVQSRILGASKSLRAVKKPKTFDPDK